MPRRLTQKEFEERVLETIGPDYKVLGEYVNKDTKILVRHFKCGNEFLKRPHDIYLNIVDVLTVMEIKMLSIMKIGLRKILENLINISLDILR